MRRIHENVACTVCGCVCDDLTVTTDAGSGRVVELQRACVLAEPWFRNIGKTTFPPGFEYSAAIEQARAFLRASRYPLIYGLSRSSTAGQRAAVALAEALGGTIDTTASTGHAPSIMALQQVGESTCTLGEVKQRADTVIFWGSDPAQTHPRFLERYLPERPGLSRRMIVVDSQPNRTAEQAHAQFTIPPGSDWETLWQLRLLLKRPGTPAPEPLPELAAELQAARWGVIFFGTRLTTGPHPHRTIEALLQLVTDLNSDRRFYARRMRRYGDVAGADSVLAWQTGYPFGVNFSAGFPRYNPGEFTGPDLLARGEADLMLLIGADTITDFPPAALDHLRTIPLILLDEPGAEAIVAPTLHLPTATYGVHQPGTAYRLDEVPIPLRVLLPTELPSEAAVLEQLHPGKSELALLSE
ncbi:MAG: formylmethanofuran dehydrogenase subunit B [Gemmataceae bacterium]